MKHNYLILDPGELEWDGYECRMLAANAIEGVLRFQIRQVDESIYFYYEITSRQPLSRMLDGRSLRAEELRSLIVGIARVVDRMEQYLLRESSVMLLPDYLYVEPENFRVWLCLVPGIQSNFPEDYAKLLEYLLGKVDHQDKDSVILAYALYQETRKPDYGMNEILRLLQNSEYKKQMGKSDFSPAGERGGWEKEEPFYEDGYEQTDISERDGISSGSLKEKEAFDGGWKNDANDGGSRRELKKETTKETKREKKKREKEERRRQKREEREAKRQKKQGLWARIREWWRNLRGRKTDVSDKEESENIYAEAFSRREKTGENDSWETMFASEEDNRIGQMEHTSFSFPREDQSQDAQTEEQDEMDWSKCSFSSAVQQDTLILGALNFEEQSQKNHRLIALDPGLPDIELRYYPFIIGKQENLVDFVLERDVVSRLHMRIDYVDSEYTIEDLNSTNGTVVAGKMLEANETVAVKEGDEVKIADCRYRFVL